MMFGGRVGGNFYTQPAWRRVRQLVLERDGWRCRIKGRRCEGQASEVDHIVPMDAGGAALDPMNLRAACPTCNRGRANRSKSEDGWRRSPTKIVLVVGPVAGGKSTYIAEHAGPNDMVVDYDAIAQAIGPQLGRANQGARHKLTNSARNALLRQVRRGEVDAPRVWIASANPEAEQILPHHEVVVCDPGYDEVMRRCAEERPGWLHKTVERWYRKRESMVPVGPSREW